MPALTAEAGSAQPGIWPRQRAATGQAEQAVQASAAPPSPALLRRTIESVRAEGPLDTELPARNAPSPRPASATAAALAGLPLWRGDVAGLVACPLPLPAEADAAAARLDAAARECAEAQAERDRLADEIAAVEEEIVRLTRGRDGADAGCGGSGTGRPRPGCGGCSAACWKAARPADADMSGIPDGPLAGPLRSAA